MPQLLCAVEKAFRAAVAQDNKKFLATISSHRVPRSYSTGELQRNFSQNRISSEVSVHVVNLLEVVDVTEQQREHGALPLRPMHFLVQVS
jgi:hypothetical protein